MNKRNQKSNKSQASTNNPMSGQDKIYQLVTDRIIAQLEKGVVPWRQPWYANPPANLISKRPYRGVNKLLLSGLPYQSEFWITFDKAAELAQANWEAEKKAHPVTCEPPFLGVRGGEHCQYVVKWLFGDDKRKNNDGDEPAEDGKTAKKTWVKMMYYKVWNVEQTMYVPYPAPVKETIDFQPIQRCEQIVAEMPNAPKIEYKGKRAVYVIGRDTVQMPPRDTFHANEDHYRVLFHELTHSTAAPSRVGRPHGFEFGSPEYAKEELIAEIGAAILCNRAGIDSANAQEQQAAYIASWLTALRNDRKLIVLAAQAAQKAADFILDETPEYDTENKEKAA